MSQSQSEVARRVEVSASLDRIDRVRSMCTQGLLYEVTGKLGQDRGLFFFPSKEAKRQYEQGKLQVREREPEMKALLTAERQTMTDYLKFVKLSPTEFTQVEDVIKEALPATKAPLVQAVLGWLGRTR